MSLSFESAYCKGTVEVGDVYDKQLIVKGKINEPVKDNNLYYVASAPPDYRSTFTGSGLPFATQVQAFQNTPNKGVIQVFNGQEFQIQLMTPNAYYVGLGTVYVPPTLYLEYINTRGIRRNVSVKLSDGIPYRSLTYPGPGQKTTPRANAMFYSTQFELPVRSQEQILRDSAYPINNKMDNKFWGYKPPM